MLPAIELSASFSLTQDEARLANVDFMRRRGVTSISLALYWIVAVGRFFIVATTFGTSHWTSSALRYTLPGLLFIATTITAGIFAMRRLKVGVETTVRFADDEISIVRPRRIAFPWKMLLSVHDTGVLYVFLFRGSGIKRPYGLHVVIPKRAFSDGGAAFWHLAERRMLGKRWLLRRADATSIINTASTASAISEDCSGRSNRLKTSRREFHAQIRRHLRFSIVEITASEITKASVLLWHNEANSNSADPAEKRSDCVFISSRSTEPIDRVD